jgi:hypothetical protein
MPVFDNDWTKQQAQGLFDSLELVGGLPNWKSEHLQKLRDWCSAREEDPATIEGQLEFVGYELCNSYEGIGRALKQARTVEEARKAVEPYVNAIEEDRDWFLSLKSRFESQRER